MKQKKFVSLLLALAMMASMFVGISPIKVSAAELTPADDGWYQISTAAELVSLSQSFSYYKDGTIPVDAKIRLMADIDMAGNDGFRPIGDNSGDVGYFQGEFDGNGHIISNLTITYNSDWSANLNDPEASLYVGFFGYVAGGSIHDLGLVNVDYTSTIGSTGGIVGMTVGGTFENCFVTGKVQGASYVGGLVGRMRIAPVVKNCYAFVDVSGNDGVGGLVGALLANTPASVTVENCLSSGIVDAVSGTAGGLLGTIAPVTGNTINNCMALASSVTGSATAGAFCGTDPGVVLGTGNAVLDSMVVGGTSVTATPDGVAEKGTDSFSEQAAYTGWDFTNTWTMVQTANGQYPVLKAFAPDMQPLAPWLVEIPEENDETGYTPPSGGGAAPTSVTYLWDSFGQPQGQFSARFNWVTSLAVKETVLYYAKKSDFEVSGKYSKRIVGTNKTVDVSNNEIYNGKDNISLSPVQSHKAATQTLEAGIEYVWCIGNGGQNIYTGSFKTPAADVNSFEFIWISDPQTNGSSLDSTIDAYASRAKKAIDLAVEDTTGAAFILSTGDQVNYSFDTWEWDAFFSTNQEVFGQYPLYLIAGNHELDGNTLFTRSSDSIDLTMSTIKGRFNAPQNGAAYYGGGINGTQPLVNGINKVRLDGDNYYYIYGDTLFMMLENVDGEEAIAEQVAWMKSVVKNNPAKWRVAALHMSLFPGYREQPANFKDWTDGMDAAGVDLVLMGHEHIYLRTKLMNNGAAIADQNAYGEGTTYITNSPATNAMEYTYSSRDYTNVYSEGFGSSYAAVSITPDEIRITAKGYDGKNGDTLTVEDDNALVTNKPRAPDLSSYNYPAAADAAPAMINDVTAGGIAKEDQSLLALITPRGASVTYQWQVSADGAMGWTDIPGADKVRFTVTEAEVDKYLRVAVTGNGDFGGSAYSHATNKVLPLRTGGDNAPGYTLDLSSVPLGSLPADWMVNKNNATIEVAKTPDDEKAVKVVDNDAFVVDIPFGPQRSVFDISYSLYVETNGTYPLVNDRYYSSKLSFLDSLGEPVAWSQPMTWGDCGGEFYWFGDGGQLGFKTGADGQFIFTDTDTAGKWFKFVYSFDFIKGTYTVTVNGEPIYASPSCDNDTFIIPPASSEITGLRLEDGLPGGSSDHRSESVYYYKDIIVGDGGAGNEDGFKVWTMNSLNRASKVDGVPMAAPEGAIADTSIYALKGETTSFQAVVTAPESAKVTINNIDVSGLAGPNGSEISADSIDLYREHYIHVPAGTYDANGGYHSDLSWDGLDQSTAANKPDTMADVWYPDALIPFEQDAEAATYKAVPYTVDEGDNMPFWFDVNVPANAAPGTYTGTYTVMTDLGELTGTITLTVWNHTMPAESKLYTSISIKPAGDYGNYPIDYQGNINAIKELLKNRFNDSDPLTPEQYVQLMPDGQRYAELGFWANASWGDMDMDDPATESEVRKRVEALKAVLGDDVVLVDYLVDEIEYAYDGILAGWDDFSDPAAMAAAHDVFRSKLYAWHQLLSKYGVKLLAVCKPYRDLLDDSDLGGKGDPIVDIFVTLDTLYEQPYPAHNEGDVCADIVKLAQDAGCQVWTYTALIQDSDTPSWQLDYAPINFRIPQGFINQAIGATGYLNWTSNAWSDDPWTTPWNANYPNALADGVLVYPGADAGVDGFVPSIRLKYARDGVYDYDYIQMLKDAGYETDAMNIVKNVAEDFKTWTKDPQVLLNARIELGRMLDAIGETHTIKAAAGAHGTISPTGEKTVIDGKDQAFTFTPDYGYLIDQVLVDGLAVDGSSGSYTIQNVISDHTISVTFKPAVKYIISAKAVGQGSISPEGDVWVIDGEDQTFIITPDHGYMINKVTVDGREAAVSGNSYTFKGVTANHTIKVSFKADPKHK